ncbi:ABC transporter ATP-binding protein, partial [Actinomadura fibrosa]
MGGTAEALRGAARSSGRWGLVLAAASLLEAATLLTLPATVARAVDAALAGSPIAPAAVPALGVLLLATVSEAARRLAAAVVQERGALHLRRRLVRHVLALDLRGQRAFDTGDLLSRLTGAAHEAAAAPVAAARAATSVVISLGGLAALFALDVRLGLLFLCAAPAAAWTTRSSLGQMSLFTGRYMSVLGELSARLVEAVRGAPAIRAAGTLDREIARVRQPLADLRAAGDRFWDVQRRMAVRLGLAAPLTQVLVLGTAGVAVASGGLGPGALPAASAYTGLALGLLRLAGPLGGLARAHGCAARVQEVLDAPVPATGARALPNGGGRLTLRGIGVRRGEHWVLRDVNLDVPAGCSVALVGRSGAGKSALAEVAGGLLSPDTGDVELDGVPLRELDAAQARVAIAYAFERPNLLGDTVADAVAYADRPVERRSVRAALAACGADAFVARLPHREHTAVAGLTLSGGELQRLGLARAVCRDARVVILDDATSSLDGATEARVGDALDRVLRGRTRLVAGHRERTAARADLVAWL